MINESLNFGNTLHRAPRQSEKILRNGTSVFASGHLTPFRPKDIFLQSNRQDPLSHFLGPKVLSKHGKIGAFSMTGKPSLQSSVNLNDLMSFKKEGGQQERIIDQLTRNSFNPRSKENHVACFRNSMPKDGPYFKKAMRCRGEQDFKADFGSKELQVVEDVVFEAQNRVKTAEHVWKAEDLRDYLILLVEKSTNRHRRNRQRNVKMILFDLKTDKIGMVYELPLKAVGFENGEVILPTVRAVGDKLHFTVHSREGLWVYDLFSKRPIASVLVGRNNAGAGLVRVVFSLDLAKMVLVLDNDTVLVYNLVHTYSPIYETFTIERFDKIAETNLSVFQATSKRNNQKLAKANNVNVQDHALKNILSLEDSKKNPFLDPDSCEEKSVNPKSQNGCEGASNNEPIVDCVFLKNSGFQDQIMCLVSTKNIYFLKIGENETYTSKDLILQISHFLKDPESIFILQDPLTSGFSLLMVGKSAIYKRNFEFKIAGGEFKFEGLSSSKPSQMIGVSQFSADKGVSTECVSLSKLKTPVFIFKIRDERRNVRSSVFYALGPSQNERVSVRSNI